ncbi:MAG: hypothetical protein R2873_35600 [Caldilineaceae bacterium]
MPVGQLRQLIRESGPKEDMEGQPTNAFGLAPQPAWAACAAPRIVSAWRHRAQRRRDDAGTAPADHRPGLRSRFRR